MNNYPIKPAKTTLSAQQQDAQIVSEALSSLETINEGFAGLRRVTPNGARTVVKRSLAENSEETYSARRHKALTSLSHFAALVQKNKTVEASASNTDLLPVAHPMSTKPHAVAPHQLSIMKSRWYAADPRVSNPLVASLLASAFSAPASSAEYEYAVARLSAMGSSQVPREALVAAFKMGANKGYWIRQLRDSKGRFAFMGGGLRKLVRRANGVVRWLTGKTVSTNPDNSTFIMELPDGKLVRSAADASQSIKAILPGQQTEEGYSKAPAQYSSSDTVVDEDNLEVVESPDGWTKNESWAPDELDREYYGKNTDLGTAFLEADGNYEVIKFDKANAPAKDKFEAAQQKESEGQDVVAYGQGKDGELDPNLPVYFLRRNESDSQPFAAVQTWAEVQRLTNEDVDFYEQGELPEPSRPITKEASEEAEIPAGTELEEDQIAQLEGDVVNGDPNAPSSKVKAYEKKLAQYEAEGGEFPIDPRKDYFLGDDGTIVDLADGVVVRDALGNTQDGPGEPEEAPEAPEAPEAEPDTAEETYTPESAPEGLYEVDRGEYTPEGATVGQQSEDYTDDPTALAEEYSAADLTTALKQSTDSVGFGQLQFAEGDELVPAEALYNALKEKGEDADQILDTIYKEAKGEKTPDVTPDVVAELGEDLDEPAQGEPSEKQMPPLIEGLTEDEQQAFLESGNYEQYLEDNESYSDAQVPEGYYNIDPDPFTPIDTDIPEGAPEGFSVNPVDIANDYATEDLENELRRSLTPDSPAEGYGVLGMKTPEGEDFVANVPAEAIRDALQLQGVDTKPIIDDVYEQGFKGQEDDAPTPEQIEDALEGEDVEEAEAPEAPETEEQPAAEEAELPADADPDGDGIATGEPEGPAKVTAAAKDLQPGDVTAADYFTIEEVFSDEESEEKKPGSVWVVGYYPGHQTQKTKLWNANVEVDVYRNVPTPEKGDLPELSKPKPKEFDPEGKIFKDEQLGVFVPKDAEARSKYLDELDQYNKDLATAKGLWSDAPEPGSLGSWQTEEVEAPFTPGDSVGVTTVKATRVLPGDIAFKKEKGNDFFEYFIIQGVEEVDGKAVIKGFYPGHESQDKEWNATTEITVMRGATELPEPGNLPALNRPAKGDPDFVEKKAAFNAAKKASAETFTPPLNPEELPEDKVTPKKQSKPDYPAFSGEKLKELIAQADGDPVEFMALLKNEKLVFLDFETTGQSFDSPTPIQVAYTVYENGEPVTSGSQFMNPEEALASFYTNPKNPDKVLKDPSGKPVSDEFLEGQQSIEAAIAKVADVIDEDSIVIMHKAAFDDEIMKRYIEQFGLPYNPAGKIDTLTLARAVRKGEKNHLEAVAGYYGIEPEGDFHDAITDTEVLAPVLFNLLGEMGITKQGLEVFDYDGQMESFEDKLNKYDVDSTKKKIADTSLASSNAVKDAFDGKDLPEVDEILAGLPKNLPTEEDATDATDIPEDKLSEGDFEVESVLGGTISNNWVEDDENTADLGPVFVEDWKPGDLLKAPMGGWFEVQEIIPDPENEDKVFVRRKLLTNGQEYGMGNSWVKFKSYDLRRRNNLLEEPVVEEAEPQIDTEAKVESWQSYDIKQDSDGVFYADGISGSDVQKLRNGELTPPQLPFFAPMGGGNKPDQGDGYFFSANGKRFWGKFGAAGLLLRRKNSDNEYEYFLAKRSSGLSQGGGKWGYPGGAHKNKEDGNFNTANTALAEFKEEVGGDISDENANKLGSYDNPVAPDWSYITHFYEVGPEQFDDLKPTDGENSEVGWFTAEQISKMAADGDLQPDFAETADTMLGLLTDDAEDKEVETPEPNEVTPVGIGAVYDTSNWKKVAGQKGTAAGGFYVDPETGQQYYVKKPKGGDMQAVNEVLASALYEAAGLDVGRAFLGTNKKGETVIVSPVIDGTDGTLGEMAQNQNILDAIKKGFAVDAWLNNYDVIGLEKDNIILAGMKPFRIDAGGALLFRAQGQPKTDEAGMDTNVGDQINSLRDPDINPQAASVFGDMTDEEIAESAKLVQAIDESTIDELAEAAFMGAVPSVNTSNVATKLADNLKRRRKELIEKYNLEEQATPKTPEVSETETPEAEAPEAPETAKKVLNIDEDLEPQIQEAIDNGEQIVFKYNGKNIVLSPDEIKTAKSTGNVNVVGTHSGGVVRSYTLTKMEQADTPDSVDVPETPPVTPESDAEAEIAEKPTALPEGAKEKLIEELSNVAEAIFGKTPDKETLKSLLQNMKEQGGDSDVIDSVLEDIDAEPVEAPSTPEEKVSEDIVQDLAPEDPELASSEPLTTEEIEESLLDASITDPELIWKDVKESYDGTVLENGHIVVSSTTQPDGTRYDVVVRRTAENSFAVYHRITNPDGTTKVYTLKKRNHSAYALGNSIAAQIANSQFKPKYIKSKSKPETDETLLGTSISAVPTAKEAYVAADGTILEVGSLVQVVNPTHSKAGLKGKVTTLMKKKSQQVDADGNYIYTDYVKVKYEDGTKNQIVAKSLKAQGSDWNWGDETPPPSSDGDGGTPPAPDTPETPTPAAPEPETTPEATPEAPSSLADGESSSPFYSPEPLNGANTLETVLPKAMEKNSTGHLTYFGADNYSDYKSFLKGMFIKDPESKNLVPGMIVSNTKQTGGGEDELASYGVITDMDAGDNEIAVSYFDGPLSGTNVVLDNSKIYSKEALLSVEQAKELGIQISPEYLNKSLQTSKDKKEEYEKELKAKAAKAKKDAELAALKAENEVSGGGFEIAKLSGDVNWNESPIEAVPSLGDALRTVKEGDGLASTNGVATLVDSDEIDAQTLKVQKVQVKGNKEKIRVTFKLTDWAGNKIVQSLNGKDNFSESSAIELPKWEKGTKGLIKWAGKIFPVGGGNFSVDANSNGTTITGPIGDGDFTLHRASKDPNAENVDFHKYYSNSPYTVSLHNEAQLLLPADATAEDIAAALTELGVESVRPPAPEEVKGLIENKLIWQLGGKPDGKKNYIGKLRQEKLKQIEEEWGVTADDVEVRQNPTMPGELDFIMPKSVGEAISKKIGTDYFYHGLKGKGYSGTTEEKAKFVYDFLMSGGILSTAQRWNNGINIRGMSSEADLRANGGNYVFTYGSSGKKNSDSSVTFTHDGAELLRYLGSYGYPGDGFGHLQSKELDIIESLKNGHQFMFKSKLGWSSMVHMGMPSSVRQEVLKMLKENNTEVINGVNLKNILEED